MKKKTTEQFIKELNEKFPDKYNCSKVSYVNNTTKVTMICKICGFEWQARPSNLLTGYGCPYCSGQFYNTERFIKESSEIHKDKYDYSITRYFKMREKVKIICPAHGMFEQIAENHLKGHGCKKCIRSKGEGYIMSFLDKNKIYYEHNKSFKDLKDKKKLSYDFYIPSKNLLIEFNGNQHYEQRVEYHKTYHEFLVQKHHDWLKRKYARGNNIKLLTIPYWEFDNMKNILIENVLN